MSNEVKRWTLTAGGWKIDPLHGSWVKHSDYTKLEQRSAELVRALEWTRDHVAAGQRNMPVILSRTERALKQNGGE